jgi:hypothetical protein
MHSVIADITFDGIVVIRMNGIAQFTIPMHLCMVFGMQTLG